MESKGIKGVDMDITIEKTSSSMSVKSRVSDVHTILKYSDYVSLILVLRNNLGKKVDRKRWDNVEVAWEEEASKSDDVEGRNILYAISARYVRYGQKKISREDAAKSLPVDVEFHCGGLSLLLRRDDDLMLSALDQDVVYLSLYGLDVSLKRMEDNRRSIAASIGKVFLFDVRGRTARGADRIASYNVIVEGYTAPDKSDRFDSQVVVTADSTGSESSVSFVVNRLSVAALLKPMEELIAFLGCEWNLESHLPTKMSKTEIAETNTENLDQSGGVSAPRAPHSLQLKLVLHFPRLIFVADESNKKSRALVLEWYV
jgi:hypothetical protein